jgi:hypothetical protein
LKIDFKVSKLHLELQETRKNKFIWEFLNNWIVNLETQTRDLRCETPLETQ